MMTMTDEPAGTVDATCELILGEETYLRRFARRFVRCEADADDLVQETILRAFRARDRFQPGTSVRAWMTTILRRVFLTASIRARRRGLATETDSGESISFTVDPSPWPSEHEPTIESVIAALDDPLRSALERVPEIYRHAFCLSVIRELSCAEIAAQLRVPKGTAMSRVHRAREALRRDLGPPIRALKASRVGAATSSPPHRLASEERFSPKLVHGPRKAAG